MLCCSAQNFDLLCSILCSCRTVLLEYIHLYHKIFNMVTVLLEYIQSSTYYSSTNNNVECSIRVYSLVP